MYRLLQYSIVFFTVFVSFTSCKKKENTKEDLMNEFLKSAAQVKKADSNSTISLVRAEKINDKEILMEFKTELDQNNLQPILLQTAMTELMLKTISKNPKNRLLISQGVNFHLQLLNKEGKKIFAETVNKSNLNNLGKNNLEDYSNTQLSTMLEMVNNQLPKVDSAGVKITKVSLGSNNELIYNAIVPKDLATLVQQPSAKEVIKKNMSKDQNYKQMLTDMKIYGITAIVYQYKNANDKLLVEVKMKEGDFK